MRHLLILAVLSVSLSACMIPGRDVVKESSRASPNPTPGQFAICHGHGCSKIEQVSLDDTQWNSVTDYLKTPPTSAGAERKQLMLSLAQMEKIVGEKTGTSNDIAGSFAGVGKKYQMDCVDEMTNTATYLTMLNKDGLLRFHQPTRRVTQSFFGRTFWTHTVVTVTDQEAEQEYIIDTWAIDNGELPYIMPIEDWDSGKELARVY